MITNPTPQRSATACASSADAWHVAKQSRFAPTSTTGVCDCSSAPMSCGIPSRLALSENENTCTTVDAPRSCSLLAYGNRFVYLPPTSQKS